MADKAAAQALADKLMGKAPPGGEVIDSIIGGVRDTGVDRTDEDHNVPDDEDEDDGDQIQPDGDEQGDEDADDGDDTDADDDGDDDDQQDDEDYDEVAYSDDDVIEVPVDGELVEVSLRDLKAAYSGEGAIQKRLKEATETRKAASNDYALAMSEIETQRTNLLQTLQQLDEVLFTPLVDKPDPKLRQRNMNQYLMEKDAYDEDQLRIAAAREDLRQKLQVQVQTAAGARHKFREAQQAILMEKCPELASPKTAPKVQAEIMEAAAYYGFTPQMVAQVDHHGVFLMARDAARWLNLQKVKNGKTGGNGNSPTGGTGLKRKKLRAGGIASIKTAAQKSAKERQTIAKRAKATGSQEDVTAMILSNARNRSPKGTSNGRQRGNR